MNLAQLIYNALHQPQLRLALESGTLDTRQLQVSPQELAAVQDAFRHAPGSAGQPGDELWELLFSPLKGWDDGTER